MSWSGFIPGGPSLARRIGKLWLIGLVVVDSALRLWASAGIGIQFPPSLPHVYSTVSILAFWIAFFLLLRAVSAFIERRDAGILRRSMHAVLHLALWAFHLYLLLVWSHVVTNGSLPNPVVVEFLLENAARIPQHVLQTAPLLTIVALLAAWGSAWLTERAVIASVRVELSGYGACRREWLAGTLSLLVWLATASFGTGGMPATDALAQDSRSDDRNAALVRRHIQPLPYYGQKSASPPGKGYPVIVILIESLRHDLLVEQPDAIPFLKSLHDDYVGFDSAYATASHSNLTDLAFWYGQYPLRGAGKETFPRDAPWKGTSMFGAFKSAGYATAYISSQNEKWGNMINWLDVPELDYFFDSERFDGATWENHDDAAGLINLIKRGGATAGKVEDSQTLSAARRWIEAQGGNQRFFLGMNLQNTHFSYVMPPHGLEPYQPSDLGMRAIYYRWPQDRKRQVRNRYLNAVANVDRLLKEFADVLRARGLWDECLFVVLGDNGEAFYEHGFGNHSGPMYDETVRTLVAIKPPASLRLEHRRIATPVSHIDVAATIPVLAGLPVPESFQGEPVLPQQPEPPRPVYMYSNAFVRQYAMVEGHFKLLLTEYPETRTELYDLKHDPDEKNDLGASQPLITARMTTKLLDWRTIQSEYYAGDWYRTRVPPRQFGR